MKTFEFQLCKYIKDWAVYFCFQIHLACIYLPKISNGNNVLVFWKQWRLSGVFIAYFEQILHIVLVFPQLTLNNL